MRISLIWRVVFGLALIVVGVWLWREFFPSPERVIAGRFAKLARLISVQPGQGYVPRMLGAQKAGSYFATNVEINVDVPEYHSHNLVSRDDIVQALMGEGLQGGLTVKFLDLTIVVGADGLTAQADMTVDGRLSTGHDSILQQMKFTLKKIDGQWLITRAQTVRTFAIGGMLTLPRAA